MATWRYDIILSSHVEKYFTSERSEGVEYFSTQENVVSPRHHVISPMLLIFSYFVLGFIIEGKLVFFTPSWNFVDLEPINSGLQNEHYNCHHLYSD